jgi:hypothetical protein
MVCTLQTVTRRMPVLGTHHLPAELNTNADMLSRLAASLLTLEQALQQSDELRGASVLDVRMGNILPFCDPHRVVENEGEFERFWAGAWETLRQ